MKKLLFSALVLTACQSFEAGGPAEGQCPKAHIDNGSGICRPLNSMTQQELFVARIRLDEEARMGSGGAAEVERAETQFMIDKIIQSNRMRKSESGQSSAKLDGSMSLLNSPPVGQRTTPVSSKRMDKTDYGTSMQMTSTQRTDMSEFGNAVQTGTRAAFGRK